MQMCEMRNDTTFRSSLSECSPEPYDSLPFLPFPFFLPKRPTSCNRHCDAIGARTATSGIALGRGEGFGASIGCSNGAEVESIDVKREEGERIGDD